MAELYSSNSSLTKVVKWTTPLPSNVELLFSYPSAYVYPKIILTPHSPFDGYYIPDLPVIAPWNYDRILRRLHKTDQEG
jgi:hypothetical protein